MEGTTLKARAVVFAMCAGAVAFILALFATSAGHVDVASTSRALIPAIVCAIMCWASAERAVASTAAAIDSAIARLAEAARGDLQSGVPPEVAASVPVLAASMDALFRQLAANLASVHRLARFDAVTGLANRTNFRRSCEEMLAALPPGRAAALLFIDLDRFKAVNDTLGHAIGDQLLALVGERLRVVAELATDAGSAPLIGRLAGDEFTIFAPALTDADAASKVARAILAAIAEPFDVGGAEVAVGASIGIAMRGSHGATLTDLMRAADAAMYHAKARGRGRIEFFSDELAAGLAARVRLESDLRAAIVGDQFTLVYQPQVSAHDGRIVAAEALLRWRHPAEGLRLPGTFIQCAEETGLIVEIGEWVIATVAATIARWGRMGIEQRLAVNISPRQIDHAGFFRQLREAMRAANAPAHLLELEITESLAMHCSAEVVEAITQLRADGATIAIDDFGPGYSNLARLRDLPVDRVKLDRSLVEHVATAHEARTIAQAVVALVHGLGCEAVAEGIESDDQAEVLRIIGCDVIQGYAIAEPMDEAVFLEWVRGSRRAVG